MPDEASGKAQFSFFGEVLLKIRMICFCPVWHLEMSHCEAKFGPVLLIFEFLCI